MNRVAGSVVIRVDAHPDDGDLRALMLASWGEPTQADFEAIWSRSLAHLCAFSDDRLVGYVNIAWDGGAHASVFDTTVHPDYRRKGIGVALVKEAAKVAREHGAEWLHVDYEPRLAGFYGACGFAPTNAGLMRLDQA
jgi:ribosomal protein S18 acetylase RimI-like enzyme